MLLYDWLAPLISRTTHGVSLPDSIGDLVSRLRRRRSRDDEDGDDDDDDELDDEAAALLSILPAASIVVDDSDDVVRANPAAYRLGIVNDDVIVVRACSTPCAKYASTAARRRWRSPPPHRNVSRCPNRWILRRT